MPQTPDLSQQQFRNGLCILRSIERHELVDAGVIPPDNDSCWAAFRDHPWQSYLLLDDERAAKCWTLMKARGL